MGMREQHRVDERGIKGENAFLLVIEDFFLFFVQVKI